MSRPFTLGTALETDKEKLQQYVKELQNSARMERKLVSECLKDMLQYITENSASDYLAHCAVRNSSNVGKQNPFAEKKKCVIL